MDPVRLTEDAYHTTARASVHPHEHAVCAYAGAEELRAALGAFIRDGLAKQELCVFVHAFSSEEEAWRLLEAAYPGAAKLRADQLIVVNLYRDAFEGAKGHIDYEHVTRVVSGLVEGAREQGRAGVRIFVDASRVYLAGGRAKEWFAFESWLGPRLQSSVGLVCAYREEDVMRSDILPEVLRTHSYRFGRAGH